MVSPEIVATQERDSLEQECVQAKGRNPAQDFPEYTAWTIERQVRFLKPVVGKAMMARAAEAKEAVKIGQEAIEPEVMVINESQIGNHCNHGYQFKCVLPSGKIIIERKAQV